MAWGWIAGISVLAAAMAVAAWSGLKGRKATARDLALAVEEENWDFRLGTGQGHKVDDFANTINTILHKIQTLEEARGSMASEQEALSRRYHRLVDETHAAKKRAEASRRQDLINASGTLEASISKIQAAADHLEGMATATGRQMRSQLDNVGQAADNLEQISATFNEVARNTDQVAEDAQLARTRAEEGAAVVENTMEAIAQVNHKTSALGEVLADLGSQAEAIEAIMGVINEIADQTNLLALNAAIEAARAGDAGRGFAVVADEVRKLAEKTMAATRDVGSQISAIQGGVQQALGNMDQARDLAASANELAEGSGRTLAGILDLSASTADQVRAIAAATHQQSTACEEVNQGLRQIRDAAAKTMDSKEASEEAIHGLREQVAGLADMNAMFRFIGNGSVQKLIHQLAHSPELVGMQRRRVEQALSAAISKNKFVELLYVTDARGVQVAANIAQPGSETPRDAKAVGKDWSSRSWFTGAMEHMNLFVSDIYVSQATGENCITVSAPFWGPDARVLGVIAADVRIG
jgi:methyl-accepting chemotaxis protein